MVDGVSRPPVAPRRRTGSSCR